MSMSTSIGSLVGGVLTPLEDVGELGPTDEVSALAPRDLIFGVFGCSGDDSGAVFLGFDASCFVFDVDPASLAVLEFFVAGVFNFGVAFDVVAGPFEKNDIKLFCLSD